MEQKNHLWKLSNERGTSFILTDFQSSNYSIIKWRGIVFKINIQRKSGRFGWPSSTEFHISSNIRYFCSVKVFGNRSEQLQNSIFVSGYYLHIYTAGNSLRLTEYDIDQRSQSRPAFKIILCQDYKPFKILPHHEDNAPDLYNVKLFEERNQQRIAVSEASYENKKLTVEYWEMGRSSYYEDEYFIEIKEEDLTPLYALLLVKENFKRVLLQKLRQRFKGPLAFKEFRTFIELNNIPHHSGVRHD